MIAIGLTCATCGSTASWLLPRWHMQPQLWAVAQRCGWSSVDGTLLCPTHNPDRPIARHLRRRLFHRWNAAEIDRIAQLRQARVPWSQVAADLGVTPRMRRRAP